MVAVLEALGFSPQSLTPLGQTFPCVLYPHYPITIEYKGKVLSFKWSTGEGIYRMCNLWWGGWSTVLGS